MFSTDVRINEIENLTVEGVAGNAVAYTSALAEMEERFPDFLKNLKRAGGDSSGSITSLLVSLGFTGKEIENMAKQEDYQKLLAGKGFLNDGKRLLEDYGIYDNSDLLKMLQGYLKQQTGNGDLTFGDLHLLAQTNPKFKDLYVIATQLTLIDNKPVFIPKIFSFENAKDTRIVDVILASSAAPPVFPAVRLEFVGEGKYIQSPKGQLYVDGGLSARVIPVILFDDDIKPLREAKGDTRGKPIPDCKPFEYAVYLLGAMKSQDQQEWKRTAEFNRKTLSLKIATAAEIKQLTGVPSIKGICPITHPIQKIESEIDNTAESFVFESRNQNFEANNERRTIFITTPPSVPASAFVPNSPEKIALLTAGKIAIQQQFPTVAEAFALTRVPTDVLHKPKTPARAPIPAPAPVSEPCITCVIV